jgi:DNA-nicking Smr family endonuclease
VARKKKAVVRKKTAGDSRLAVEGDGFRPFAEIDKVVPEKLKQPEPKKPVRKEPLVVGYDPDANFGDILAAWETGGELTGVTKRMKSKSKVVTEKPFAQILAEWEGKKEAPAKKKTAPVKKSKAYVPAKSFADILDQYEGEARPKKRQTAPAKVEKPPVSRKAVPTDPAMKQALEDRQEEEVADKGAVAWSFADTYRKWNELSDEEKALRKAMHEKAEAKPKIDPISRLRAMEPQKTLDLHGMTVAEAEKACASFLEECAKENLQKICIITGKGLHNDQGVSRLKDVALSRIRLSGVVREAYTPKACYGGSGAIWIILKGR